MRRSPWIDCALASGRPMLILLLACDTPIPDDALKLDCTYVTDGDDTWDGLIDGYRDDLGVTGAGAWVAEFIEYSAETGVGCELENTTLQAEVETADGWTQTGHAWISRAARWTRRSRETSTSCPRSRRRRRAGCGCGTRCRSRLPTAPAVARARPGASAGGQASRGQPRRGQRGAGLRGGVA